MTLVAEPPHDGASRLDEQAAAELTQELALVTRALFAQLLPGTAERAIAGVPGLGGPNAPVGAASPEQVDAATAPAAPAALSLSVPLPPVPQETVTAGLPVVDEMPAAHAAPLALPVEAPLALPTEVLDAPVQAAPEPLARKRAESRSMALLQEISFLDE